MNRVISEVRFGVLVAVTLLFSNESVASRPNPAESVVSLASKSCRHGIHPQTNGPYALFVFCDDAAGTNIAVVHYAPGPPRNPPWGLTNRFWQEQAWAADAIEAYWLGTGNQLLVLTSPVYGTGALYLLSLDARTAKRLYPAAGTTLPVEGVKVAWPTQRRRDVQIRLRGSAASGAAEAVIGLPGVDNTATE